MRDGTPGLAFVGVIAGACVTNADTETFGIRMQHRDGFVINLDQFTTYRATGWSPGGDPQQGGGYGCTSIWLKAQEWRKIDLSSWVHGVAQTVNVPWLPTSTPPYNFKY